MESFPPHILVSLPSSMRLFFFGFLSESTWLWFRLSLSLSRRRLLTGFAGSLEFPWWTARDFIAKRHGEAQLLFRQWSILSLSVIRHHYYFLLAIIILLLMTRRKWLETYSLGISDGSSVHYSITENCWLWTTLSRGWKWCWQKFSNAKRNKRSE